jgi:hypothetical protein
MDLAGSGRIDPDQGRIKRIFPPKKALKLRDFPRKSTKYAVSNVAIHYCFFALDNIAELCLSVAMNIN